MDKLDGLRLPIVKDCYITALTMLAETPLTRREKRAFRPFTANQELLSDFDSTIWQASDADLLQASLICCESFPVVPVKKMYQALWSTARFCESYYTDMRTNYEKNTPTELFECTNFGMECNDESYARKAAKPPTCMSRSLQSIQYCHQAVTPSPVHPNLNHVCDTPAADIATPAHKIWRLGDWKCLKCGNHNFGYRVFCKRCKKNRDGITPETYFGKENDAAFKTVHNSNGTSLAMPLTFKVAPSPPSWSREPWTSVAVSPRMYR